MRKLFPPMLVAIGLAVAALTNVPGVRAHDTYYVMLFAAEGKPNLPRLAHTFAAFIKVKEKDGVDPASWPIDVHTISWLPATRDVRVWFQPPEKGANLDLPTTLKHEVAHNAAVYAWGPFQIEKGLYVRALEQIERLNAGRVAYKALDGAFRPNVATNCFHAISDIVDGPLLNTGVAFGVPATQMVLEHLAPRFVEPQAIRRDVARRLDLKDFPINYRDEVPAIVPRGER